MTPLPRPDGHDGDGTPWWRLRDGRRLYARPGHVLVPDTADWTPAFDVECDGLAYVAAARWGLRSSGSSAGGGA